MGIWKDRNDINYAKCNICGEEDGLVRGSKSKLKQILRSYGWTITDDEKVYCSYCSSKRDD